ncbi:hypothetical protein GCM10027089_41390 [Nocardia thraciensis]
MERRLAQTTLRPVTSAASYRGQSLAHGLLEPVEKEAPLVEYLVMPQDLADQGGLANHDRLGRADPDDYQVPVGGQGSEELEGPSEQMRQVPE